MTIVLGILLILASVFLIVAVLMQGGKSNNRLSGAIAGGAETFFGKSKAEETAAKFGIPLLARMPVDPKLSALVDRGVIELMENDSLNGAADAIEAFCRK